MGIRRVQSGSTSNRGPDLSFGATTDYAAARYVDRNRRAARDSELVEAVGRLDSATDPAYADALMTWISNAYAERAGGELIGIFGRCHLGFPYVDHRLDVLGGLILEHFTGADQPPHAYGAARPLARNEAYAYIEVYSDGAVVPVREDGKPVL